MIRAMPSGPVLIFLHLPKTAGSTLARIIERQYDSSSILDLYGSDFGEELGTIPPTQMNRLRMVMGHFYFGAHTFLLRPSTYITVLREPIDRVISHYYYVRGDPSHYLHELSLQMSLREYVQSCNRQEPNNDQTRLLAGRCDTSSFGTCSDEMLAGAKRNLATCFAVVGLTEEFDRSLILFKRALGWRWPFYTRQNSSQGRLRKEDIPVETLRVVEAYNELDIELYRYARERFQEQIRRQGRSFEKEVQTFRTLEAAYGRLYPYMSATVKKLGGTFSSSGARSRYE